MTGEERPGMGHKLPYCQANTFTSFRRKQTSFSPSHQPKICFQTRALLLDQRRPQMFLFFVFFSFGCLLSSGSDPGGAETFLCCPSDNSAQVSLHLARSSYSDDAPQYIYPAAGNRDFHSSTPHCHTCGANLRHVLLTPVHTGCRQVQRTAFQMFIR